MTKPHRKALIGLICVLTFSLLILGVSAVDYPSTFVWSLQNNVYFGFNNTITLSETPSQGVANDSSLVGYWNANEGSGNIMHALNGNGNNGTLYGPTWVNTTHGFALSFDGVNDYIRMTNQTSLILKNQFTLSFQFSPSLIQNQTQALIGKSYAFPNYEYYVYLETDGRLSAGVKTNTDAGDVFSNSSSRLVAGGNYSIAITWVYPGQIKIYINGNLEGSAVAHNDTITNIGDLTMGDLRSGRGLYAAGVFDNLRIYNRTLSASEVAALSLQPDPVYSDSYYSYQDSVTNNTLLIHIDNGSVNSIDSTLVTCTNFFVDSRLTFTANNSASVNIWTNLGEPPFTSGVWNSNNYTTTLKLDASSAGELDWNCHPSSASNLSLSSMIVGKTSAFSVLWSDDYSLSGGGYIFSTNNSGQWVNVSWVAFSSTPCWSNATLTLNNKVGAVVGFREYANNSLNLWGDSGIYAITTINDSSAPTTSNAPTPSPIPTPTIASTPSPTPTASPITTPTIQPETSQFPTQTVVIVASAIFIFVAVFALALKKGYVTIEVVNEQDEDASQGENQDYAI